MYYLREYNLDAIYFKTKMMGRPYLKPLTVVSSEGWRRTKMEMGPKETQCHSYCSFLFRRVLLLLVSLAHVNLFSPIR